MTTSWLFALFCLFPLALSSTLSSATREQISQSRGRKSYKSCIYRAKSCGDLDGSLLGTFNSTYNRIGCSERCEQDSRCQSFTWLGRDNVCQTLSKCNKWIKCNACFTGDRGCEIQKSYDVIVTGGRGNDAVTLIGNLSTINTTMNLPTIRWGHISTSIGDKLYVCGGKTNATEEDDVISPCDTCDVYSRYDSSCSEATDDRPLYWCTGKSLIEARHSAVGVGMFGRLFVLGGRGVGGRYLDSVEEFHVHDIKPADANWRIVTSLPVGVSGHCALAVHDGIFVAGGQTAEHSVTNTVAFYNLTTDLWTTLPPLETGRAFHGCSLSLRNGRLNEVLVTGGKGMATNNQDSPDGLTLLDSVELFSFRTHSWETLSPLPSPIAYHSQSNNGVIRLFGGIVNDTSTDQILELDDSLDSWKVSKLRLKKPTQSGSSTLIPTELV